MDKGKFRSSNDVSFTFPTSEITQTFDFISNGRECVGMRITKDTIYYEDHAGTEIEVYNAVNKWSQEDIKFSVVQINKDVEFTQEFSYYFALLFTNVQLFDYKLKVKISSKVYSKTKLKMEGVTYEIY